MTLWIHLDIMGRVLLISLLIHEDPPEMIHLKFAKPGFSQINFLEKLRKFENHFLNEENIQRKYVGIRYKSLIDARHFQPVTNAMYDNSVLRPSLNTHCQPTIFSLVCQHCSCVVTCFSVSENTNCAAT